MLTEITTAHFKALPTTQKLENHQPRIVRMHKEKKENSASWSMWYISNYTHRHGVNFTHTMATPPLGRPTYFSASHSLVHQLRSRQTSRRQHTSIGIHTTFPNASVSVSIHPDTDLRWQVLANTGGNLLQTSVALVLHRGQISAALPFHRSSSERQEVVLAV